jgi:putative glutamine amidotransferase
MKAIIGLLGEVDDEKNSKILPTYVRAIENAGGLPILLPFVENEDEIESFVSLCDGFLFTGGADINPIRYGEKDNGLCKPFQEYRDDLEFRVFEKGYASKKPILAICRGAQLVNVALGGRLYQDIPSQLGTNIHHNQLEGKFDFSHDVQVEENTPLYDLVKSRTIRANSFHHQAVKTLGRNLTVMAKSADGVIEGFYQKDGGYLRCYQWHPERLIDKCENNRAIFIDFIKETKKI